MRFLEKPGVLKLDWAFNIIIYDTLDCISILYNKRSVTKATEEGNILHHR